MAISLLYNPVPTRLFEADGDFASGAKAYFYLARTTTPMTVYTDLPLAVPHTWPVIADAYGLLPPIYIPRGEEYKVRIEDAAGNILYAVDGIMNPAETDPGGGGVVVTASQIAQTGDVIWNASGADRLGWVRCNKKTISRASGTGDTANDDCEALFAYLWNNFAEVYCQVSGGRGANAAADWSAAKTITSLDMRGQGVVGLDTMGNTALNLIQKQTLLSVNNGVATANVASSAGLCAGMRIIAANGVPDYTYIAEVQAPTLILMNRTATATSSNQAARFSRFLDAEVAGSYGGEATHSLLNSELPAHSHGLGGGFAAAAGGTAVSLTGAPYIGATQATGLNAAINLQPPARVGTWWIKK